MYSILPRLVGTLSLQNPQDIDRVSKMITTPGVSLQKIRQQVPFPMWEDKKLFDLLIKQRLPDAINKTFQAKNTATMKKEWEDVSFLLGLLEWQRNERVIEDYTKDSAEVIEEKLDDDVIKRLEEDSAEVIEEDSAEVITELSRQELLGHYLCTTIALVTKRGHDMFSRNISDKDLINCMFSFQKNIIQILLKNKANPNIKIEGSTPIHWITSQQNNESMKLLLAAPGLDPNIKNNKGDTVLHWAAQHRAHAGVKLLLAAPGLDPNIKDPNGNTPLHWTMQYRDHKSMKLLLADSRVNPNIPDIYGDTVLHLVVGNNYRKSMKLLLADSRVNPNIQNKKGNTPLHWAKMTDNYSAISLLIEHGAKLDIKNHLGETPLHNIINLDLDSEQNGSNQLIQILDALTPQALSNIYCALQDQRRNQNKKDQLNKYMLQRKDLNTEYLMPKIMQKQIHGKKFLQNNTHKNLFGGNTVTTQCEGKVEKKNESLKEIMKKPFFCQNANNFSTLISKIEQKDQGDSDAPVKIFHSPFGEVEEQNALYQSHSNNLVGELDNLLHDVWGIGGAIVPYHPESR